jgi:hypothetical protein
MMLFHSQTPAELDKTLKLLSQTISPHPAPARQKILPVISSLPNEPKIPPESEEQEVRPSMKSLYQRLYVERCFKLLLD